MRSPHRSWRGFQVRLAAICAHLDGDAEQLVVLAIHCSGLIPG
jgi:hypothetical protein